MTVVLAVESVQLKKERDVAREALVAADAQQQAADMVSDLIIPLGGETLDEKERAKGSGALKTLLEQTRGRADEQLASRPLVHARVLERLAWLHYRLGAIDQAEPLYRQALAICREHLPADDLEIGDSLNQLTYIRRARGDFAGARRSMAVALAIARKHPGARNEDLGIALDSLGYIEADAGDYQAALRAWEEGLALSRRSAEVTGLVLRSLGVARVTMGEPRAARPLLDEALGIFMANPKHAALAGLLVYRASLDRSLGIRIPLSRSSSSPSRTTASSSVPGTPAG